MTVYWPGAVDVLITLAIFRVHGQHVTIKSYGYDQPEDWRQVLKIMRERPDDTFAYIDDMLFGLTAAELKLPFGMARGSMRGVLIDLTGYDPRLPEGQRLNTVWVNEDYLTDDSRLGQVTPEQASWN